MKGFNSKTLLLLALFVISANSHIQQAFSTDENLATAVGADGDVITQANHLELSETSNSPAVTGGSGIVEVEFYSPADDSIDSPTATAAAGVVELEESSRPQNSIRGSVGGRRGRKLDKLKGEMRALQRQMNRLQDKENDLEKKIENLEGNDKVLRDLKSTMQTLTREMNKLKDDENNLQNRIDKCVNDSRCKKRGMEELRESMRSLRQQIVNLQKSEKEFQANIEKYEAKNDMKDMMKILKKQRKFLRKGERDFQQKIEKCEKNSNDCSRDLEDLTAILFLVQGRITKIEQAENELQTLIDGLEKDDMESIQEKMENMQKSKRDLQNMGELEI